MVEGSHSTVSLLAVKRESDEERRRSDAMTHPFLLGALGIASSQVNYLVKRGIACVSVEYRLLPQYVN